MKRGQRRLFRFTSTGETFQEAATRLGVKRRAIEMRFSSYGWPEKDVLAFGKNKRPPRRGWRAPKGARAGVKFGPLTSFERGLLHALSEGMTPLEIAAEKKGLKVRKVWQCLHRIRLKLGAFTNYELLFLVGKKRIIE